MAIGQKYPNIKRDAEKPRPTGQAHFYGSMPDVPASSIDISVLKRGVPQCVHEAHTINVHDHGDWQEGRTGSRLVGVLPAGTLYASEYIKSQERHLWLIGTTLYSSPEDLSSFTAVVNLSYVLPDLDSTIREYNEKAYLFSKNGIWRVVLDGESPYMYRIDQGIPLPISEEVLESDYNHWVYRYLISGAILSGTGNRDRISDGVKIELETGTCQTPGVEKDYAEYATYNPIGIDEPNTILQLMSPFRQGELTHLPLYRTKNIGTNSNPPGIDPINGIGNDRDLYIWCADVPVCKPLRVTINNTAGTATIKNPSGVVCMRFVRGDQGNDLIDSNGFYATVALFGSETVAHIGFCNLPDGDHDVSIGHGRVATANQAGNLITLTGPGPAAAQFMLTDAGKPFYWCDGGKSIIKQVLTLTTAIACEYTTHASQAATWGPLSTIWCRKWTDTVPDDGVLEGMGQTGLEERVASGSMPGGSDVYIPLRFFKALPACDCGMVDPGFIVCGIRGEANIYYCQIGDKPYAAGQYRDDIQKIKMPFPITDIRPLTSVAAIFSAINSHNLKLNVSKSVGNADVGEVVYQLQPPDLMHDKWGVIHWQTIQQAGANELIAMTCEPHVRTYGLAGWSSSAFDVDPKSGISLVQKLLKQADPYLAVKASYCIGGGYKIWFYRWVPK